MLVPAQKMLSASELTIVGLGKGVTLLVIPAEVPVQLPAFVTMTSTICPFVNAVVVYKTDAPLCTLTPSTLKLKFVPPPPAVNVTLVPAQNVLSGSELESVGTGSARTVFAIPAEVVLHPPALVTITSTT